MLLITNRFQSTRLASSTPRKFDIPKWHMRMMKFALLSACSFLLYVCINKPDVSFEFIYDFAQLLRVEGKEEFSNKKTIERRNKCIRYLDERLKEGISTRHQIDMMILLVNLKFGRLIDHSYGRNSELGIEEGLELLRQMPLSNLLKNGYVNVLSALGEFCLRKGEVEHAEKLCKLAIELDQSDDAMSLLKRALPALSQIFGREISLNASGELAASLCEGIKSLKDRKKRKLSSAHARNYSYRKLAAIYFAKGECEKALVCTEQSKKALESVEDVLADNLKITMANEAVLKVLKGEMDSSECYHMITRLGSHFPLSRHNLYLAVKQNETERGNLEKAEDCGILLKELKTTILQEYNVEMADELMLL